MLLYFLGISTFVTTLLFYRLVYWLFQKLTAFIKKKELQETILYNVKILLIIFAVFDFSCTFIFKKLNNYVENEKGIYFSLYKKQEQVHFLYNIGYLKNERNVSQTGYDNYFKHRHTSKDFNYEVTYNEVGFRGKFPGIKKDSNEYRILTIGDSFVEGYGTSEDSTFPKLLQDKLRELNKAITVLNGGICGSNPIDEFKLYDNRLKIYNPDLVVLEINNADLEDYKIARMNGKMPMSEYFYAISHLYRAFYALLYLDTQTKLKKQKKLPKEVNKITDLIINFKQQLQKKNIAFVLVYLPLENEIKTQKIELLKFGIIKHKIKFIDLQNEYSNIIFNNKQNISSYYWKNDGHHTPKGYDLMAKTIAEELIKEYLPDKSK